VWKLLAVKQPACRKKFPRQQDRAECQSCQAVRFFSDTHTERMAARVSDKSVEEIAALRHRLRRRAAIFIERLRGNYEEAAQRGMCD
jgi:hypothetical protein